MRLVLLFSVASVALLTLAAPARASGPGLDGGADGGKPLAPTGAPCKVHADCRSNACMGGVCRARCDGATKCATTQTCTGGVCMPNDAGALDAPVPPPRDAGAPKKPATKTPAADDEDEEERDLSGLPKTLEAPPHASTGCTLYRPTAEREGVEALLFVTAIVVFLRARRA